MSEKAGLSVLASVNAHRELGLPTQPPRPKLLDQLRQALCCHDGGIRRIQELLGDQNVRTTMTCTHGLKRRGLRIVGH